MAASNATSRVFILGAGGHGRVVLDILLQSKQHEVVGFLDNNTEIHGRRVDGIPVLGGIGEIERLAEQHKANGIVIAVGDNGARRGLARSVQRLGLELISAIHPAATIATTAMYGKNVVIAAGAVVCANCQVGDSVILNTGCIVDYQSMIGEGSHLCPGVRVAARVKIEAGAFLGIGAIVVPNTVIGYEAVVGAGAVVTHSVEPLATVVGSPARPIKIVNSSEDEVAMLFPHRSA